MISISRNFLKLINGNTMKVKCTTCNGTKELEVNYEDSTEYGDFFTLKEFIDMCECGGFIDYDGHGNYATAEQ